MKGDNKIEVNVATAVVAFQEYFDKRAAGGKAEFEVASVASGEKSSRGGYGGSETFVVSVKEREGAETKEATS